MVFELFSSFYSHAPIGLYRLGLKDKHKENDGSSFKLAGAWARWRGMSCTDHYVYLIVFKCEANIVLQYLK